MRGSIKAYKKISVDSQLSMASPHKVIQMLLAGAIERLIQGKVAMENNDISLKGERLGKALDIIISLKSCLSMDEEGDVADNLAALYGYMIKQITLANRDNNSLLIDECIDILREIKSAWDKIPLEYHNISVSEN